MGIFSRVREFFSGRPVSNERYLAFYVTSNRCRDLLAGRIDTLNELSGVDADNARAAERAAERAAGRAGDGETDEAGAPGDAVWFVRKALTTAGRNRCFDTVEVRVWLDAKRKILAHEVDGGRWLEADEYLSLLQERDAREAAAAEAAAAESAAREAAAAAGPRPHQPHSPANDQPTG